MICFGFLRIFGEKKAKEQKLKFGHFGPLRRSVGCLTVERPRCPKGHPLGTPRRSFATPQRRVAPRRSYCSWREIFWIFVLTI